MIPRFYCPDAAQPLAVGMVLTLPEAVAHHALKVLRLRGGDALVLFDGTGGEYAATLEEGGRQLRARLHEWRDIDREAPLAVTLAQCLPAGDKMDWVVQKAVELGVAAVQPLSSKRSVVRLTGERMVRRSEHWVQVAVAACEQSGRNQPPQFHPLVDLPHWLAQPAAPDALRLFLSPHDGLRLAELPHPRAGVTLLIGPEGGFEEDEAALVRSTGFQAVRLGPRVLRTETAGLAALAAVMTLWGDF